MTSQCAKMTSLSIFWRYFVSLVNFSSGTNFMSILSLVLELWQFTVIRDWPEIQQSEIPPSEFCQISGDWGELWITNLALMSVIECYWMLQNSRVTAFTVFELLRENQLGRGGVKLPPTQIRVKLDEWKPGFDLLWSTKLYQPISIMELTIFRTSIWHLNYYMNTGAYSEPDKDLRWSLLRK